MQKLPQQHQDYFYIPASLKAPLATFDTIDLGDEDVLLAKTPPAQPSTPIKTSGEKARAPQPTTLITKIGGAQSRGRGPANKPGSDLHCQNRGQDNSAGDGTNNQHPTYDQDNENLDDDVPTPTNQSPIHATEEVCAQPCASAFEGIGLETAGKSHSDPSTKAVEDGKAEASAHSPPPPPPPRIGKIQGAWLQHQDSDSSSSSGSGSEAFTFRPIKGSASASANQDEDDEDDTDYTPQTRRRLILREKSNDYSLNLYPEDLDPGQIASPSKRKAYEKRLQRLQVKTSPIVRPRSTTPINVVTLNEYINSPDTTPASPFQEKLKISLPSNEQSSKSKSPRHSRKQSESQEDSCFVFNEEILFSHTRSALVVDEVGHAPPSPRRVLIPPTLSPSTSPKLGRAVGQNPDGSSIQLVYFQGEKENEIFGQPAEQQSNENWATFPDANQPNKAEEEAKDKDKVDHSMVFSDSEEEVEVDEVLTVNIQSIEPSKPADIQVILSAASSSTPSPATPDSDEAIKAAASETVIPQVEDAKIDGVPEPASRPPPIPPRRRPPPPPPPPPPDVVPGDDGTEPMTAKCDLLVDIDSQ